MRWTGQAHTNEWGNPANWDSNSVPAENDDVVIVLPENLDINAATGTVKTLDFSGGGFLAGELTVKERLTLTEATLSGEFTCQGTAEISGGNIEAILRLEGDSAFSGGELRVGQGDDQGRIENYGTMTLTGNVAFAGGGGRVFNAGTVLVANLPTPLLAGSCVFHEVDFQNTRDVVVQAGELRLEAPAKSHQLTGGSTVTGPGSVVVAQDLLIQDDSAALYLDGTITLQSPAAILFGDGSRITGTASIAGTGGVDWVGGEVRGHLTFTPGTSLAVRGSNEKILAGYIENEGEIVLAAGSALTASIPDDVTASATVSNGSILRIAGQAQLVSDGTKAGVVDNRGTLELAGQQSCALIEWSLISSGTLDLAAGAVLELGRVPDSQPHELRGGSLVGPGRILCQGEESIGEAGLEVSGSVELSELCVLELSSSSTLRGTGTIAQKPVLGGRVEWSGGTIDGSPTLKVPLDVTAPVNAILAGSLTVSDMRWSGAGSGQGSGSLTLVGQFAAADAIDTVNTSWNMTVVNGTVQVPRSLSVYSLKLVKATVGVAIDKNGAPRILVEDKATLDGSLAVKVAPDLALVDGGRYSLLALHGEPVHGRFTAMQVSGISGADIHLRLDYTESGDADLVSYRSVPGFDALGANLKALPIWRKKSPYQWLCYYLKAPLRPTTPYSGHRATLTADGWGLLILYVGQNLVKSPLSALTDAQGQKEGNEAAKTTRDEGFASGSAIYLDVENFNSTDRNWPQFGDYIEGWIKGVLADGEFKPAVYCHVTTFSTVWGRVMSAYDALGRRDRPRFWVVANKGFSLSASVADCGVPEAFAWQNGSFAPKGQKVDTYGQGTTMWIDPDIAAIADPSAP